MRKFFHNNSFFALLFFILNIIILTLDSLSRIVIINSPLCQVESVKNECVFLVIFFWERGGHPFPFLPSEIL